jgi:hypothetical protein
VARCVIVKQKPLPLPACLPATWSRAAASEQHPLQKVHIEMDSKTLSRRYGLTVHQTVQVKELREISDCPLYCSTVVGMQPL